MDVQLEERRGHRARWAQPRLVHALARIVDEVYYPRVDQANTRDFGLLVSGRTDSLRGERDTISTVDLLGPGVPGYRIVNTCVHGRYEIEKTIISDPERSVLVQRIRFAHCRGRERLPAVRPPRPHIGNQGYGNDGWWMPTRHPDAVRAARRRVAGAHVRRGWQAASCGYVGVNDGWRQVRASGHLTELYTEARDGNIALTGEIQLAKCRRASDDPARAEFVIALAFGTGPAEAAQRRA